MDCKKMADKSRLAMVLKNLISQMTQNSEREDPEKTMKRIMREALKEKSASADQTEILSTLMSVVKIKEKALDTKQQELENAESKERELKAQITKLNQQISRMKKESSTKGGSGSVEESMQVLVDMLAAPAPSKSKKKIKKVASQVDAAQPSVAEQSRGGAYPKGPQPACIPAITNAKPPQPKQHQKNNCFNPKQQNKFCNKESFTGSAFREHQTQQWHGDGPPDGRFNHASAYRNASQNLDHGDFNQEGYGKSNRGGFVNDNCRGKPGFVQHTNFSDACNLNDQIGFNPRIPPPVNKQSGKGYFQSEAQHQIKPVNFNHPSGYGDRKFEQGVPADSRDYTLGPKGNFQRPKGVFHGQKGSFGGLQGSEGGFKGQQGVFEGPKWPQGSFEGHQGGFQGASGDFQGSAGGFKGPKGDFKKTAGNFQKRGRGVFFIQRGSHKNFNERRPQQKYDNSGDQLPCDAANNNQNLCGAVRRGSYCPNKKNWENRGQEDQLRNSLKTNFKGKKNTKIHSRSMLKDESENASDSDDTDSDSDSKPQTNTLDTDLMTESTSPNLNNDVPAFISAADRKWLDKQEGGMQTHKMVPEGLGTDNQEGGGSAAAEASDVSVFVGTGIPSEEEAKAKNINMNQADRKWLDKQEGGMQTHKMVPVGLSTDKQEGGGSAAAEASDVSLFVGTGIPSEEEAKAKNINMNQAVKDVILIAKTDDGIINSTPVTLGDMVQFKKKYPNATAIIVK